MVRKQLSAEPRKKIEVEGIGLDDEDHTAVDHTERENHTERDQDIQPADRVQTHCTRPVALRGRLQENHEETNQRSEKESHTEIDQDHHQVFHEGVQLGQVD